MKWIRWPAAVAGQRAACAAPPADATRSLHYRCCPLPLRHAQGLTSIFEALQDLSFYIALSLPCAIMFSLGRELMGDGEQPPTFREHVVRGWGLGFRV